MQARTNSKLTTAEIYLEYLKYAALIKRVSFEKLAKRFERDYKRLDPSLSRLEGPIDYMHRQIVNTVQEYEAQNELPRSTTYGSSARALNRAWLNMCSNMQRIGAA